jgi:hypothetical protein
MCISTVHEFWSALEFDAQSALWPLVLRGWLTIACGAHDFHLRLLGCALSLVPYLPHIREMWHSWRIQRIVRRRIIPYNNCENLSRWTTAG